MAETQPSMIQQELAELRLLLWGNDIKSDIFRRWSQGFYFSLTEPSALEQAEGGPCAIIAPVQAFIIKNLLSEFKDLLVIREKIGPDWQMKTLVTALTEIISQCNDANYCMVYIKADSMEVNGDNNENVPETANDSQKDPLKFHQDLDIISLPTLGEVSQYFLDNIETVQGRYGVLLFLYSVILSRGLQQVKSECDSSEPLIDKTYGYGSQSLINLMITGRASTYVWDHYQDVGGLKLKGIEKQSQVGFLTLMEYHRYCTVGSFYKNPTHPVWVVASDTHLTVLFSDERKLVSPETKSEQARRVFKSFDPDGNNFIGTDKLQDVLGALDLVSEIEYVNIMKKKLDGEGLGIILLNAFMDEFFPREEWSTPDLFTLIHYNGLPQSNVNGQVQYHVGSAILLESDLKSVCESNPMLTVLQTKWPSIEVNWCDNITPSLN